MKVSESKFARCLYFTANALARRVEKMAIESWKPVDLSPSHAYLLMMVIEAPGLQPGCIANHLQLTPSTVTRLIEKLEEKKLIVRTNEGKITNVYPTPKGKNMQDELKACVRDFDSRCKKVLSKEESCGLLQNMQAIADKLET